MKKFLLSMCAVVLVAGMATSSFAAAVTSITWDISVTFASEPIDLVNDSTDPLSFGILQAGVDVLSNDPAGQIRTTLHNAGYATVDYTVAAACSNTDTGLSTTPWTLGTTIGSNGVDTAVLAGVFTGAVTLAEDPSPYGRDLVIGDFADNDVLTGSLVAATTDGYAIDGIDEVNNPEWMKGYAVSTVPTGSTSRSMRYLLQMPTSLTDATISSIVNLNVTIGANAI